MWRWLAIAAVLYGFGHPSFGDYRPAAFDRSLREFHRDVNRMTAAALQTAAAFDQSRSLQSLNALGAQLQAMLAGR